MRYLIILIFFMFAAFPLSNLSADEVARLERKIQTLQGELKQMRPGKRTWRWPIWGVPESQVKRQKEQLQKEIEQLQNSISAIKNTCFKITDVKITRNNKNEKWLWYDVKPDLYLKIGDTKITRIQRDDDDFEVHDHNFLSDTEAIRRFKWGKEITVQVWDSDVTKDNEIFSIKINGRNKSPVRGQFGVFKWEIRWEKCN